MKNTKTIWIIKLNFQLKLNYFYFTYLSLVSAPGDGGQISTAGGPSSAAFAWAAWSASSSFSACNFCKSKIKSVKHKKFIRFIKDNLKWRYSNRFMFFLSLLYYYIIFIIFTKINIKNIKQILFEKNYSVH